MALLTPGTSVSVPTPQLLVENRLAPGRYRFQLVVIDDSGHASAPATLVVTVNPLAPPPPPPPPPLGGGGGSVGPIRRPGPILNPGPIHEIPQRLPQ